MGCFLHTQTFFCSDSVYFLFREASVRAIESVQEASLKALAKQNVQRGLRSVRRKHWFEKFNWFISSEGYLILSGSDAQQNVIFHIVSLFCCVISFPFLRYPGASC